MDNEVRLLLYAWKKRVLFLKTCGTAIILGLIIAVSIPKEYVTTAKLAPETNDNTRKTGELGGLAAMAGINLNNTGSSDAISPELYPDVVQSIPFLVELFPVQVTDKKGTFHSSVYDYISKYQHETWWDYILGIPFRGLAAIKQLFSEKKEQSDEVNPFYLTAEQQQVINGLRNRISIFVDKKTMVITINVRMQDPVISATLTQVILEKLQTYITNYRTQKAKQDLKFTEKIYAEARDAYYKSQQAYAKFEDSNKNIISASYRTEQERLKNEMTLTFNVYNSLAQKYEQDKLKVQEQTPVYAIIDPATVPLKAISPNKVIILMALLFMALLATTGYLFIKENNITTD